jgi:hypothetical protein
MTKPKHNSDSQNITVTGADAESLTVQSGNVGRTAEEVQVAKQLPERKLAWAALRELQYTKEHPFVPTADMGMVWVLSAPGTYETPADDGVYAGESSDRKCIDYGVKVVKQITALRVGKPVEEVTKEDIEAHGPIFYYNGESSTTKNTRYAQNAHLEEAMKKPDFPIPASKMIIDDIDVANTPAQMRGIIAWLNKTGYKGKIPTVSIGGHNSRVGRYIEHDKDNIPKGVTFIAAPATQTHNPVSTTKREVDKVVQYHPEYLASKSYFADSDPLK